MKIMLGTKQYMTQYFDEKGAVRAATLISSGPITTVQVKDKERDGYDALQVGFGVQRQKRISKALQGHFQGLPASPKREQGGDFFRYLKEFKLPEEELAKHKRGDVVSVSVFEVGDLVKVSGISKGKGFQGVVKRHGFHGGPRSHGQKHSEREAGSIGATGPQRVFKGTRMPGRMGTLRVTVKNLKVLAIDKENNQLLVSGAVPGKRGTLLEIRG